MRKGDDLYHQASPGHPALGDEGRHAPWVLGSLLQFGTIHGSCLTEYLYSSPADITARLQNIIEGRPTAS